MSNRWNRILWLLIYFHRLLNSFMWLLINHRLADVNGYQSTNQHRLVLIDRLVFRWLIFINCVRRIVTPERSSCVRKATREPQQSIIGLTESPSTKLSLQICIGSAVEHTCTTIARATRIRNWKDIWNCQIITLINARNWHMLRGTLWNVIK